MRIFHRLVGDPPQRGFGSVIATPGFPGGADWADQLSTMRLTLQTPFRLPEENSNGLIEHHEAYEYQTLRYGQPVLIRSVLGVFVSGGNVSRPHGYSHLAAPTDEREGSVLTDYATPSQLLCYDGFQTLESFWALSPAVRSFAATEWFPPEPAACEHQWAGAIPGDMRMALVARYWKAASDRAFSPAREVYPLAIVLSEEKNCRQLVRQAKDFFAAVILPGLPEPALNILSMSAAVPAQATQLFQPTALAFLYPEDALIGDERTFDLRNGQYTPLEGDLAAFAMRLLSGAPSPLLNAVYGQYRRETGCPAPTHCPLLADFDVAFTVDRLENASPAEPGAALNLLERWRELDELLARRHGMAEAMRRGTLSPVMRRVLGQLTTLGEALPLGEALTAFLLKEALAAQDTPMLEILLSLLERHQSARMKPVFLSVLPFPPALEAAGRTALLLDRLLNRCFVDPSLDAETLRLLLNPTFTDFCRQDARLQAIMARFLTKALDRHPENHLFLLPLSTQFLDGVVLLKQSLRSLMNMHIETPPDESVCNDVREAFAKFGNPENHALLDGYLATLFWQHRDDPDAFYRVALRIDADMSGTMREMFAQASALPDRLDAPLNATETERMSQTLLPLCAEHLSVQEAFRVYMDRVLARSLETGADRFAWLCGVDKQSRLLGEETRMTKGFCYAADQLEHTAAPLPQESFQTLRLWASGPGRPTLNGCEAALAQAYDRLGEAGRAQSSALLSYLQNVAAYPFLRSLCLGIVREGLMDGWAARRSYWVPVDDINKNMARGNLRPDEVLEPPVAEKGRELLTTLYGHITGIGDWMDEIHKYAARPADAFRDLWFAGVRDAFILQYSSLVKESCRTPGDLETLEKTANELKAEPALAGGALLCVRAALNAHRLIGQLPTLPEAEVVRRTQEAVAGLLACRSEAAYASVRTLLKQHYLTGVRAEILRDGFVTRIAVGLLCTALDERHFMVQDVLPLAVAWPQVPPRRPYEPASLPYLQAITALFATLARFNPAYSETLCDYLLATPYYIEYARALRADRKQLYRYYPWRSERWSQSIPPQPQPLKRWLDENTNIGKGVDHA
ncbi:MAG: hypothetical protein LLF96_07575 [Eubacteriales bacterium]|nr:hypothetical protein [Eubacteriales bacterium]